MNEKVVQLINKQITHEFCYVRNNERKNRVYSAPSLTL